MQGSQNIGRHCRTHEGNQTGFVGDFCVVVCLLRLFLTSLRNFDGFCCRVQGLWCGVDVMMCVAVCCSVLQCVAVCCRGLQCVAVCCSVLQWVEVMMQVANTHLGCFAVRCSVLQCVVVCCSVLQCTAVCCSVLQ